MSWPKVTFLFEPADLWVGAFWNRAKRRLYLLPLPCLGIVLEWPHRKPLVPDSPPRTLILAQAYFIAADWAKRNGLGRNEWVYPTNADQLRGYDDVNVVKLHGWDRRDNDFTQTVRINEAHHGWKVRNG